MGEDFVSHVIFHFGAHDVAIISNEIIAVKFKSNQSQHYQRQLQNELQGFICSPVDDITCNIPYNKGQYECNACTDAGK